MAFKEFRLNPDLPVKVYKRKTSRSLRLSVTAAGEVKVSIPTWTPYAHGLSFANSKLSWIQAQLPAAPPLLQHGQAVGKAHRLFFAASPSAVKPSARLKRTLIVVNYPLASAPDEPLTQTVAARACIRALRTQAGQLLPQRLQALAEQYGFEYSSVGVKLLKSRWGSCDTKQHIVLNLFLMQLPWELIDYVLLHELTHTRVMQHGPKFWGEMERVRPSAKTDRRAMRAYQPILQAAVPLPVA